MVIIPQREGTERKEKSRRNLAHRKENVVTWPDHLGVIAVAQSRELPHFKRQAGQRFTFTLK